MIKNKNSTIILPTKLAIEHIIYTVAAVVAVVVVVQLFIAIVVILSSLYNL